ncbi:MAG: hypothetical protein AB8G18_17615 [Gammaproteobacteria bacterium]
MIGNLIVMCGHPFIRVLCLLAFAGSALLCSANSSAQQIQITELSDIDFGQALPTGGKLRADIQFCVVLDQNTTYQILAYGEEVDGEFALRSGPYRLPYLVRYTDTRRPRGFRRLFPGQPLTGLKVRGNSNGFCRRANAALRVVLPANDLRQAPSGSYQATLTLMVSPE